MRFVVWIGWKSCNGRPIPYRGKASCRRRECSQSRSSRVKSLAHQTHKRVITLLPDNCRRAQPQPMVVLEIGGGLLSIHAALRKHLGEVHRQATQCSTHPLGLIKLLARGNESEVRHRTPIMWSEVRSAVVARLIEVGLCQSPHHRNQPLIPSDGPQTGHRRHPLRHRSFGPPAHSLLMAWRSTTHVRVRLVPHHCVIHSDRRMHGASDLCQP